jgi:hypothetical protein
LHRRYYYRGSFVLLEHLTPRGLETNARRLRQRGEFEHASKLDEQVWAQAHPILNFPPGRADSGSLQLGVHPDQQHPVDRQGRRTALGLVNDDDEALECASSPKVRGPSIAREGPRRKT